MNESLAECRKLADKLLSKVVFEKDGNVYKKPQPAYFEAEALLSYNADHSEFWEVVHSHNKRYSEIAQMVERHKKDSRNRLDFGGLLDVHNSDLTHAGRSIVTVYGGFNGRSVDNKWSNYLASISDLIKDMEDRYGHAWLIELRSNCSDVHYAEIAFEDDKKKTIERAMKDWNDRLKGENDISVIFDLGYTETTADLRQIVSRYQNGFSRFNERCFQWNKRGRHFMFLDNKCEEPIPVCHLAEEVWGKGRKTELGRFAISERILDEKKTFVNSKVGDKKMYHYFNSFTQAMMEYAKLCSLGAEGDTVRVGTHVVRLNGGSYVWDGEKWIDYTREETADMKELIVEELHGRNRIDDDFMKKLKAFVNA